MWHAWGGCKRAKRTIEEKGAAWRGNGKIKNWGKELNNGFQQHLK